jgi:hypothetical protein
MALSTWPLRKAQVLVAKLLVVHALGMVGEVALPLVQRLGLLLALERLGDRLAQPLDVALPEQCLPTPIQTGSMLGGDQVQDLGEILHRMGIVQHLMDSLRVQLQALTQSLHTVPNPRRAIATEDHPCHLRQLQGAQVALKDSEQLLVIP